jgi:hypothetical protein
MPHTQRSQVQPVKFRCRFDMTAADALSCHEFCMFEFPGCAGCPKAQHTVRTVGSSEDPMKSEALRAWAAGLSAPKKLQSGSPAMEKYIHRENLTLFKKRLAESHSDAEREVLLKLLADEEAKAPTPKNGIPKSG